MSGFTLANVRIYAGGLDLTSDSNKIELAGEIEEKEITTFGDVDEAGYVWKTVQGGTGSAKLAAAGLWRAGDPSAVDDVLWATQGTAMPWSVLPRHSGAGSAAAPAVGDLAWFVKAVQSKYQVGGSPGDVAPWAADCSGSSPLVRGRLLHTASTPRGAAGSGAAVQLGAVPAGRALVAGVHLLSTADPAASLTVRIESSATADFAAPTTRATFTAAQAVSGQSAVLAGPVMDGYWRAAWSVAGGAAPSFLFVVSAGIA